jgi:sialate O-acetylesterase
MKPRLRIATTSLVILISAVACWADPTLPTLFTDHMVLQQGRKIHVWGMADRGEKVTIRLAAHNSTTTADLKGNWSVDLPAMSAGGPFTLTIQGKREIIIKDVLIGEVWLASGQSNMTFSLDGAQNAATEVPKANYPQIRLFTVPKKIALAPQQNTLPAHWEICTPDTAKSFSAVAYFFARAIQMKKKVPIGVVESAWPGTTIQEWIAPEVLRGDADLRSVTGEWDKATPSEKSFAANGQAFDLEFDDFELIPTDNPSRSKMLANFDDGDSSLTTGGSFAYNWTDAPDAIFDLASPGRGAIGFAARVAGRLDGTQDSTLSANYRMDGSAEDLSSYIGIRFWVRGNGSFRFRSKQSTVTDWDDYGTSVMKAQPDWQQVTIRFRDLRQDGWGVVKEFTQNSLTGFSIECLTNLGYAPMPVSGLYEGMITPLLPYQFRGALWYQGESNALQALQYRKLLPALIRNWRDASQQKDLEFLIVQLPNHGAIPEEPGESAWAELREAELMTLKQVPHTGLAVTIDVGDPADLHPHRKMEVGDRLARWALGTVYKEPGEYSGPLYESMKVEGNSIRIRFAHVGTGLEAQGATDLVGFAIAGADRKFHWAQAHIDADSVLVESPEVPSPAAVRYAWGDSPRCNLFNEEGLPASPFRTDDWIGDGSVRLRPHD